MSWTLISTNTIGSATVLHQRGDGVTDQGHRLVVDGTPATAAPVSEIASSGDYRAALPECDLDGTEGLVATGSDDRVWDITGGGGSTFPAGPAVVTLTAASITMYRESITIATGDGDLHSWVCENNAGSGSTSAYVDFGGGPTNDQAAGRLKDAIDALSLTGVTVTRTNNSLSVASTSGVKLYSNSAGIVVA